MNKILKWVLGIVVAVLAIFGLIFIGLIIRYYPAIDRLYIRPCHYYPHAFADCVNKEGL